MAQMLQMLRFAVLLVVCSDATDTSYASYKRDKENRTSSRAHAHGAGFVVAAESKVTLASQAFRGHAQKKSGKDNSSSEEHPIKLPSIHFIADYVDMAAKQINTELAYIPARSYLHIVTNSSPIHIQMAGLAAWAYDLEYLKMMYPNGWAGGWKLVAEYVNTTHSLMVDGHDVVALMAKGKSCAITFSGTHGLADWSTNLNVGTSSLPQCGVHGVHEGFFEAFLQFMLNDAWTTAFEPYLAENCSEGIHITGHSQGAAVGAVFAACINGAGSNLTLPDLWRFGKLVHAGATVKTRLNVTDLHGIGGPGVSTKQFWNYKRPDGVFPGTRFFNQDAVSFDPVPWLSSSMGLTHPKSEAVKMAERPQRFSALTEEAKHEPRTVSFVPDIMVHLPPEYLRRIIMASRLLYVKVAYAQGLPERSARPFLSSKPSFYASVEAANRKWSHIPRTSTKKNMVESAWAENLDLKEYEPGDDLEIKLWDAVWPWGVDRDLGTAKLRSQTFEPHGFEGWVTTESGIRLKVSVVISYDVL